MNIQSLRERAKQEALDFLQNESDYRMGYIDAEQPHPLTRNLSDAYGEDVKKGVRTLFSVDAEMAKRAAETLKTPAYAAFADSIRNALKNGGRVIFSGCGSSGRLSMRLEQSWRSAIAKLCRRYPAHEAALQAHLEQVGNIMTGGDYAIIRAAESFEDSTRLGEAQAAEWNLCEKDLLVGVTATGETTSILGTAINALQNGATVWMLVCSDPAPMIKNMERMQRVYPHPNCHTLILPCGPMALTGSTRMQSSSFEQFAAAAALEGALNDLLASLGIKEPIPTYGELGDAFARMTASLLSPTCLSLLADLTVKEQAVYEQGGLATLFSDECLMDVLTDTTERAPTFMTPPFCSSEMKDQAESWAFVKNPTCNTKTAWQKCFLRTPRCIEWSRERYAELGLNAKQIEKIPSIDLAALEKFEIGYERMPERETNPSLAMWVDVNEPPAEYEDASKGFSQSLVMTPARAGIEILPTHMDIFEHLALKMMLNTLSTGVMARMGRIHGNWMTNLAMSNKKLIDRSARIVADVCGISYERAMEENYFSRAYLEETHQNSSPTRETIQRLKAENR
ncbi:MAG: hypothetical protein IJX28_07635 [Clostridia bacterium]|nr:hypothetical protein [Clostridia bacterium]